jgi:AraC-like DNA-binding protein
MTAVRRADDQIRHGPGAPGIERLEVHLAQRPFAPHRHDTYAIGITLAGVQRFHFRGQRWHCLPGQCHVLHPDELHDGMAGTAEGFAYRILHVDPALLQQALGGAPLPFVSNPVLDLGSTIDPSWWDIDRSLDELDRTDLLIALANLLHRAAGGRAAPARSLAWPALCQVRDRLLARAEERVPLAELERLAGLDRWTLARQFRAAFGTSPSRFRTLRQLDRLRCGLLRGEPLVHAALAAGFADQSHMGRQFKRAYGLTPGRWLAAVDASRRNSMKTALAR